MERSFADAAAEASKRFKRVCRAIYLPALFLFSEGLSVEIVLSLSSITSRSQALNVI